MSRYILPDEYVLWRRRWAVGAVCLVLSGCASLSPVRIETAQTGETVVRTLSSQSFDELAEAVYGDETLGPALAEFAHLPYRDGIGRGQLLVLPVRAEVEAKLRVVRTADALFDDGLRAADRGAYRQAAEHFRRALAAAPQSIEVRYNLGLALLASGEPEAATPVLEEVAQRRPGHADSRYAFGKVLRERRAWDRATAEFKAAMRLDGDHAEAAYALARTHEDRGDADRAIDAFRSFIRRFPDDALTPLARSRLAVLETPPDPSAIPSP